MSPDRGTAITVLGLLAIAGASAALLTVIASGNGDLATALLVGVVLCAISVPLLARAASSEVDPAIRAIIFTAFTLKLIGAVARHYVAFEVYGGAADAADYATWGRQLAPLFRSGDFSPDVGTGLIGTGFIRYATGLTFAVGGASTLGGFLLFSTAAFWGLYGFYRAFTLAEPQANHRRYAALVLLMPSLLFWPSSIGKEALVVTGLGMTAYGAAKLFQRQLFGWLLALSGLGLVTMVRPHVAAIAAISLAVGFAWRRRADRTPLLGPAGKIVGVAALIFVSLLVFRFMERYFEIDETEDVTTLEQVLNQTEERTSQGGSEFTSIRVTSPTDVPAAVFTVLLRPLPNEARNLQQLATSLESMGLIALALMSWRRVLRGFRLTFSDPYLRFAGTFSLLFCIGFASVSNFGILARQRVQFLPFVLILLAMPLPWRGTDTTDRYIDLNASDNAPAIDSPFPRATSR